MEFGEGGILKFFSAIPDEFVVAVSMIRMLPLPLAGQCASKETSRLARGAFEAFLT